MLLTLAILTASPSAAALAESGALRGALVSVDVAVEQRAEIPLSQMTREQLRKEYQRLEESRPPLGGQITAVALGGAAIVVGLIVLWGTFIISAASLFASVPLAPLLIGIGLVLGGGAVLVFGIIMLRVAVAERRPYAEAMDEIQQRLDGTYESQPPPPGGYEPTVPPPPPPPPPQAGFDAVRPSLVLATF